MARDTELRFNALLNQLKPKVRQSFIDAVRDIASTARFNDLVRALERGNVDEAMRILNISNEFYKPLENALVDVFMSGGNYAVDSLPQRNPETGAQIIVRFGVQSESAQEWLRRQSSRLIVEITESQRAAARHILTDGLSRGDNPRKTAIELVGKFDPSTGRRTGGTIGLTSREAAAVQKRRLDLINDGKTATQADKLAGRYASKLLKLRGERIARTETMAALNAGRMEAMRQAISAGQIRADAVTKIWMSARDARTRDAHRMLDGSVADLDKPFQSPLTGSFMAYPGDTSYGARGEDVINCRCTFRFKTDYRKGLR